MNEYKVRIRYAGSVLLEIQASNETEAREKGEQNVQTMDSDTFLSALELQHLDTEVTCLCTKCKCELYTTGRKLCNTCEGK